MLDRAIIYDIESFPNAFTFAAEDLHSDARWYFEISEFRDDRAALFVFFEWCRANNVYMIGFFSLQYDYPIIHFIFQDIQSATPWAIYAKSQEIIKSNDRFGNQVWESERFAPQIDLAKIHHFDNKAKSTGLKALEINMRSENVMESPVPFGTVATAHQITYGIKPYNETDVSETKKFAWISMPMIAFRFSLLDTLNGDVLNFNDTKIGKQTLQQALGDEVCFYRDQNNRKKPRQTVRQTIPLRECIFPYIQFQQPEFNRVLNWMKDQTLTADDVEDPTQDVETKGVFKNIVANVNGFEFVYGTGGIHGSVEKRFFQSDDQWTVEDDDVTGLYPSVAIVNELYPEHLGREFVQHYARLKTRRDQYEKGTPENSMLKLASNGAYGDSANKFSFMLDKKFTMGITLNGQLMLSMYAEWLMTVDTLQIIQINTDGVTFIVHRAMMWRVDQIRKAWQSFTKLNLEHAQYARMWIRDVNNYVAETTDGKLKKKGAYWTPDKHPDDIQKLAPTGWYRDFSADICAKAAIANMTKGADIRQYILGWNNMFDFMLREKARGQTKLMIGDQEQQKTLRYYIARNGGSMRKIAPPTEPGRMGWFKPARGTDEATYIEWHSRNGNVHNPAIHTKNKSVYEMRNSDVHKGYKTAQCNHIRDFSFDNLDYEFYITEANKLVIR